MDADDLRRFIQMTERYVRDVQPRLNRAILEGRLGPEVLYARAKELEENAPDGTVFKALYQVDARHVQRLLFAILSAAERFEQGQGRRPGEATGKLGWVERIILACSPRASHPVFPSPYSHWIENPEQQVHYESNAPGSSERMFGDLVRETDCTYEMVSALLLEVLGSMDDDSLTAASGALETARDLIAKLQLKYQAWMPGSDLSAWPFTPIDFNEMRQWLVPLKIGGAITTPANAAHLTSTSGIDCVLGTVSEWYGELIRGRRALVPFEHARRLDADLRLLEEEGTVLDRCARLLGLDNAREVPDNTAKLADSVQGDLRMFVSAVRMFGKAWASLSGTHFRQIVKYLEKYDSFVNNYVPGYEIRFQAVSNRLSVSGMSHAIPRRILDERREQPLIVALNQATRLARAA